MSRIVGRLSFDFVKLPYQYTAVLTPLITEYKEITDILAPGTNIRIGSLVIDSEVEQLPDGTYTGQVTHTYNLPEGSIRCTYLVKSMTSTGAFLPNSVNTATITSGSGDFLGSIGTINAVVDSTPVRKVSIVFDDRAVYPLPVSEDLTLINLGLAAKKL